MVIVVHDYWTGQGPPGAGRVGATRRRWVLPLEPGSSSCDRLWGYSISICRAVAMLLEIFFAFGATSIWPRATWRGAATPHSFFTPRQRAWNRVGDVVCSREGNGTSMACGGPPISKILHPGSGARPYGGVLACLQPRRHGNARRALWGSNFWGSSSIQRFLQTYIYVYLFIY